MSSLNTHRDKLDRLNEALTDRFLAQIDGDQVDADGNPVPLSNDDIRLMQAQLKNNSISVPAMPDNPQERLRRLMQGLRVSPGHLEARQKALPHLSAALALDPADSTPAQDASER